MPTINLFGAAPPGPPTGGQGPNRAEETLSRQFGALQHRAGAVLTPTAHRNLERATQVFADSVRRYQSTYGATPNYGGDINALRGSLGSVQAAYSAQNINRLGGMAQRSTDTRDWKSAATAQHDLNRIEKSVREQLAFWRSPAQRATVQRQENAMLLPGLVRQELAIEQAKERIGAARIGMSPAMAAFSAGLGGRGFGRGGFGAAAGGSGGGGGGGFGAAAGEAGGGGGFMGMLGGMVGAGMRVAPVLSAATAAVAATVEAALAPSQMHDWAGSYIGLQKPFLNFDIETSRLGRMGGFNSRGLREAIFPELKVQGVGFDANRLPFHGRSARMQELGMGYGDYLSNLQNYGVAQRSTEGALNTAEDIRRMSMMSTGLSEQQVGQYLGRGRALGAYGGRPTVTVPGMEGTPQVNTGMNTYWNQYQKVTSKAVQLGLDQADVLRTMVAMQASTSIHGVNAGEMGDLFMRLAASGMPGMRSGALVPGLMEAANQGIGQAGTSDNRAATITLAKAFGPNLPTSEAELQKKLGVSDADWQENWAKSDDQKNWVKTYLQAARAGNQPEAMQNLGQVLQGHQSTVFDLIKKAFPNEPDYLLNRLVTNVMKIPFGQSATLRGQVGVGNVPGGENLRDRGMAESMQLQQDLGLSRAQAAGAAGLFEGEGLTAGNEKNPVGGGPGGFGIAQWTGSRREAFFAWAKANNKNPSDYWTQQQYFEEDIKKPEYADIYGRLRAAQTPTEAELALEPYFFGNGSTPSSAGLIRAHRADRQSRAQQIFDTATTNPNQASQPWVSLGQLGQQQQEGLASGFAAGWVGRDAEAVSTTFTGIVEAGRGLIDLFLRLAKQDQNAAGSSMGYEGVMTPGFGTPSLPGTSPVK